MVLQTIKIDFPSDILLTLNESEQELKHRIKFSLAVQLYVQQKVTIGKAAQIAGMSRFQFESALSAHKIPISTLEIEDVLEDIQKWEALTNEYVAANEPDLDVNSIYQNRMIDDERQFEFN